MSNRDEWRKGGVFDYDLVEVSNCDGEGDNEEEDGGNPRKDMNRRRIGERESFCFVRILS